MSNPTKFIEQLTGYATPIYSVECCICGETSLSRGNFSHGDKEAEFDEFARELHENGWRISNSKTFGHIGLHCHDCHKKRNKPDLNN